MTSIIFAQLTLKGGVESMLMHYCPEVKSVEEVVDSDIEQVCYLTVFLPLTRNKVHLASPPPQASNSQLKFVEEMTGGGGGL